jgi:hypothetical protein
MEGGEFTPLCECTPVYETRYESEESGTAPVAVIEALATSGRRNRWRWIRCTTPSTPK